MDVLKSICSLSNSYCLYSDLHVIDCTELTSNKSRVIYSYRIDNAIGKRPSPRWGHIAASYNGCVYVFGGRGKGDNNDLYKYNPNKNKWKTIKTYGSIPEPRRRATGCFAGSSLVVFGGYNGVFLNDLSLIDVSRVDKIKIRKSSLAKDVAQLCDGLYSDSEIFIKNKSVKTHKGLLLHLCSREDCENSNMIRSIIKEGVYRIRTEGFEVRTLKSLIEFLYTGTIVKVSCVVRIEY